MTRSKRHSEFTPYRRLRPLAYALGLAAILLVGVAFDIQRRDHAWAQGAAQRAAAVEDLGFVDLALSSSARWLRSPTSSERTAPLTDAPLAFDTDPAGALIGPPEPRNAF